MEAMALPDGPATKAMVSFTVFLLVWMVTLGACVGSFLNVVIYRLPRGKSLVHPGSACPACGHTIRWYHNVPVFGWLVLSGRCYDCRSPISVRYPLVEALVALAFAALTWWGPLSGGANVPRELSGELIPSADLWKAMAYHALLLCTLFSLALIEYDAQTDQAVKFPWLLWLLGLLVGFVTPWVWPLVQPVSAGTRQLFGTADTPLAGLLVAFVLGSFALPAKTAGLPGRRAGWFLLAHVALIGVFLGWQMAGLLVVANSALWLLVRVVCLGRQVLPWSFTLPLLTLLAIVTWDMLYTQIPWLRPSASPLAAIGSAALATLVLCSLGRRLRVDTSFDPSTDKRNSGRR